MVKMRTFALWAASMAVIMSWELELSSPSLKTSSARRPLSLASFSVTELKIESYTYAGDGIRVNSIHPGFIDTPLTQAQDPAINANVIGLTPMKRAGTPLEIANGCLFLASDESSFMTGAELVIDGGYLAQ